MGIIPRSRSESMWSFAVAGVGQHDPGTLLDPGGCQLALDVGVIAGDGTRLAASASDGAIRTYEQIAAEILAEAGRIDAGRAR